MRIIAGTHRGRRYLPPKDENVTRPIVDRVKEALFSRLMSLGMLEGPAGGASDEPVGEAWRCADVFSGTGSLGLECLSRGAEHCTFVERDRDALDRLRRNLDELGFADRSSIVANGAFNPMWLSGLRRPLRLVFLDPPYAMMRDEDDRARVATLLGDLLAHLEEGGIVVLRTHEDDPPLDSSGYDGPVSFRYGTMTLHFYQCPLPEQDDRSVPPDDPTA